MAQSSSPQSPSSPHTGDARAPVLDLDTLIVRPKVAIDGVLFEILSPDEVSVIDSHRFAVSGKRIDALADEAGVEAEEELQGLIEQTARRVLVGVPDDVFARLSGAHKWAVVDVFTGLLLGNRLGVAGAMQRAMGPGLETMAATFAPHGQSTGASGLPGSSGSMADIPRGGWLKRLLRWCGLI